MSTLARIALLLVVSSLAAAAPPPIREATWQALQPAWQALDADTPDLALRLLDKAAGLAAGAAQEEALIAQARGHVFLRQGRAADAIGAFTEALDKGVFPATVTRDLHLSLAQLLLEADEPAAALARLDTLEAAGREAAADDSRVQTLRGYALTALSRWDEAVAVLTPITASEAVDGIVLELLFAAQMQADMPARAALTARRLVALEPRQLRRWEQLAAASQLAGEYGDAAAALEAARRLGLLAPQALPGLARLYLHLGLPTRAAAVQREAINAAGATVQDWLLLADSLTLAHEPRGAIDVLESIPGEPGEAVQARLGELHFRLGNWTQAALALTATAGPEAAPEQLLLAGIAASRAGEVPLARRLLDRAATHERTREQARRWLSRLDAGAP